MTGVIAGALLQSARRTTGLTQEDLAEAAGVAVDTVKRWENGQRPLGHVKAASLVQLQRCLRRQGARPALVTRLPLAVDADDFVTRAVSGDCSRLGSEVTVRAWSSLVAWAAAGRPPAEAGDVAPGHALLTVPQRAALFTSIREAAVRPGTGGLLLRHQAYYLAGLDTSAEGAAWLADAARAEASRLRLDGSWSPDWVAARSLAIAAACQGDPGQLHWFLTRHMEDRGECAEANLSYWAYWAGSDPEPAADEDFMIRRRMDPQRGAVLLQHFTASLSPELPYADLSAASARSLLQRWPDLLGRDRQLASDLAARAGQMLDQAALTPGARAQLSDLHVSARAAAPRSRRST
ncbi:MAG TPA: helix-turn-helix transcriptional regulator [Streptosporangiaceae bacterium]|nr:helix-turn-helix transcriptional regulator [Streptosporangiaceae bacterium]